MALSQTHSNTLAFLLILSFDYIQVPIYTETIYKWQFILLLIFMQLHVFQKKIIYKRIKKHNKFYYEGPTTIKLSRSSSLEIQWAKALDFGPLHLP